jgi:hypothetical protein
MRVGFTIVVEKYTSESIHKSQDIPIRHGHLVLVGVSVALINVVGGVALVKALHKTWDGSAVIILHCETRAKEEKADRGALKLGQRVRNEET